MFFEYVICKLIGEGIAKTFFKESPEDAAKRIAEEQRQLAEQKRKERACVLVIMAVVAVIVISVLLIEYVFPPPNSSTGGGHITHGPETSITTATPAVPLAPAVVPEAPPPPKPETAIPTPQIAITAAAPEASPSPKPETLTEPSYQGTADTNFGKDWVIVDGVKMQGITFANPAPGGQVAIVYSDGGRNVPASSLPQGFLDAWKLSPEKLKATGNQ